MQQGRGGGDAADPYSEPLSLHKLALSPPARNIDIPFLCSRQKYNRTSRFSLVTLIFLLVKFSDGSFLMLTRKDKILKCSDFFALQWEYTREKKKNK